jgi:hypothetical protein
MLHAHTHVPSVDAIEDGDGVFSYECPFEAVSLIRIDERVSSRDILLLAPRIGHLVHECLHEACDFRIARDAICFLITERINQL